MKSVSGKLLCKVLEKRGWELRRVTGSHHIYSREDSDYIISVPVHNNRDLPTGTLRSIMRDAELVEEDL